jgi:outer membrane lipoprotein SlyB
VKRAGKVKGTSELQLSFEAIHMPDGSTSGLSAEVVELIDMNHRDDAGTVDSEGGVKGRSSTKDDISRVGASTGIGAIIGAVVGGGKGAAIGAAIGGAVGASSVLTKRGEDVRLDRGQQMKIRTANETRVQ